MSVAVYEPRITAPQFNGLRMSADEFFATPDDGYKYELLDGVVLMTPSPTPRHQRVARELIVQLANFLEANPVGEVLYETDVHLGQGPDGGDLVYRPEIVFYRSGRIEDVQDRLVGVPDLIIEVVSPLTRSFDKKTKRNDYERYGVQEYWIIDPELNEFTFLRNRDGSFEQISPNGEAFTSQAVAGFVLNLARVRSKFRTH